MKKYILILPIILLMISCNSTQNLIENTGVKAVTFGNGGGYTGKVISSTLTVEGKLQSDEGNSKVLSQSKVLDLFRKAQELLDIDYRQPGNLYSFITVKTQNGKHQLVWKQIDKSVNPKIKTLFKELQLLTK